jgi:hypothetical protein
VTERIYPPSEVLALIGSTAKGVYRWWFKNSPPIIPLDGTISVDGMNLLYVGTGPKDANSKRFLRERLKDHIERDATKSTLRRSLGCLLAESLQLKFEVARISRSKQTGRITYHYGLGARESSLSNWMEKNARVSWILHDRPWELESELMSKLVLPLNVQDNDRHPFAKTLGDLRHQYFNEEFQKWRLHSVPTQGSSVVKIPRSS